MPMLQVQIDGKELNGVRDDLMIKMYNICRKVCK